MSMEMDMKEYERHLTDAARFILQHDDFLVVAHIQPDGDAASSTYAMGWILNQLGKSYTLINEGAMPAKFAYLWGSDQCSRLFFPCKQTGNFKPSLVWIVLIFPELGKSVLFLLINSHCSILIIIQPMIALGRVI